MAGIGGTVASQNSKAWARVGQQLQDLKEENTRLKEALQEWYRLYCIHGIDPKLRNGMKRHAAKLTREALATTQKKEL